MLFYRSNAVGNFIWGGTIFKLVRNILEIFLDILEKIKHDLPWFDQLRQTPYVSPRVYPELAEGLE